jgi:steroid delta-isomerase-like uncharacterized protein
MNSTTPAIAQQWLDAWNARDVERIVACLTEDAVYEDVTLGAINRTPAETRQFVAASWTAFPDLRFELTAASVSGTHGTIEWTMLGTHRGSFGDLPATGKTFAVPGVSVVTLAGERIRHVRDYWDFATVLRQLGVLAAPVVQ